MITVAVADDHPVVRAGLVQMLTASGEVDVVAEADDGSHIIDIIRRERPQVVLTDFRMPGLDGAALCAVVRKERLPSRVIVLSAYSDPAIVNRCVECGAAGFLGKDASRAEILDAIRTVDRGGSALPDSLRQEPVPVSRQGLVLLSSRENEILVAVASGSSAPEIAQRMHLSLSTVKTYLQRIYEKLGVNGRAAAVAEALRRGILE